MQYMSICGMKIEMVMEVSGPCQTRRKLNLVLYNIKINSYTKFNFW